MATETKVKQLSEDGTLAKYKIVHFATHGAVAGEVSRTSEPGLLLTPPDKASETDDGYLSASEIAGLKLDADWVILSACNTAAGGAQGAEALSGLARAFFYAGARSLLVSHWEVNSDATVKLITKAIAELKADPKIGRAEAFPTALLSSAYRGNVLSTPAWRSRQRAVSLWNSTTTWVCRVKCFRPPAQWARSSEAAESLAQMAVRGAKARGVPPRLTRRHACDDAQQRRYCRRRGHPKLAAVARNGGRVV
jgi:hypothetical protein